MATDLDPRIQGSLMLKAAAVLVPVVLILVGGLTALLGQDADLLLIGIMVGLCGIGWLIYGLSRLSRRGSGEEDWPSGRF